MGEPPYPTVSQYRTTSLSPPRGLGGPHLQSSQACLVSLVGDIPLPHASLGAHTSLGIILHMFLIFTPRWEIPIQDKAEENPPCRPVCSGQEAQTTCKRFPQGSRSESLDMVPSCHAGGIPEPEPGRTGSPALPGGCFL